MLNAALLKYFYGIENWQIPKGYLCPPVPGRADYIHYMADLLEDSVHQNFADGKPIKCLDVGVGANCIYPIIGNKEYGWSFVGSDIDPVALESAARIVESNPGLSENIELRLQKNPTNIFREIIRDNERFSLTICNPPFHSSPEEANQAALRKLRNLKGIKSTVSKLNFGGQSGELWCEGGEKAFVLKMIFESCEFAPLKWLKATKKAELLPGHFIRMQNRKSGLVNFQLLIMERNLIVAFCCCAAKHSLRGTDTQTVCTLFKKRHRSFPITNAA